MQRPSLILIALTCLCLFGTISVIAVNCGDTWQPTKADTKTDTCTDNHGSISYTKYWRIFWGFGVKWEKNLVDRGSARV